MFVRTTWSHGTLWCSQDLYIYWFMLLDTTFMCVCVFIDIISCPWIWFFIILLSYLLSNERNWVVATSFKTLFSGCYGGTYWHFPIKISASSMKYFPIEMHYLQIWVHWQLVSMNVEINRFSIWEYFVRPGCWEGKVVIFVIDESFWLHGLGCSCMHWLMQLRICKYAMIKMSFSFQDILIIVLSFLWMFNKINSSNKLPLLKIVVIPSLWYSHFFFSPCPWTSSSMIIRTS